MSKTNKSCPYSSDCFKCPMSDCKVYENDAVRFNKLETDGWGLNWQENVKIRKEQKHDKN